MFRQFLVEHDIRSSKDCMHPQLAAATQAALSNAPFEQPLLQCYVSPGAMESGDFVTNE